MKDLTLFDGLMTRKNEGNYLKQIIEIGGMSILWHFMKFYSAFDINELIKCCEYKGYTKKEYF